MRGIASRVAERPTMDGRAGASEADVLAPWMAIHGGAIVIGRLKGILAYKSPPWAKRRACEASPRASLSARPWMVGQAHPKP
ncbi:MAG: hypothetical protein QM599_07700, partial [Pseudoxanthomonas sp.]